jgi:hypothetical protein
MSDRAEIPGELSDEMKAAIGRAGPLVLHEVTAPGIRTFARAVGYQNPVYYSIEVARSRGHRALPAPPGFFGMPVYDPAAPPPRPAFRSPFTRVLNGGTEIELSETVYAGDELEAVSTLVDLRLREGRLGPMLIRTTETVYARASDGVVVGRTRGTGISY